MLGPLPGMLPFESPPSGFIQFRLVLLVLVLFVLVLVVVLLLLQYFIHPVREIRVVLSG